MALTRPLALSLSVLALAAPAAQAQESSQPPPSIDVVGEGSRSGRNDAARLSVGAVARRRTARAALNASSRVARRVIARLRTAGIADRDIRTTAVGVSIERRRGRPTRFVGVNRIRVVVREVNRTGEIVDLVVAAGANDVRGPSFFISDPSALYRQALLAAFDDARRKAEELAARAGVRLGRPLRIQESGFESFSEDRAGAQPLRGETPTRPGTSRIFATVAVSFAIE